MAIFWVPLWRGSGCLFSIMEGSVSVGGHNGWVHGKKWPLIFPLIFLYGRLITVSGLRSSSAIPKLVKLFKDIPEMRTSTYFQVRRCSKAYLTIDE